MRGAFLKKEAAKGVDYDCQEGYFVSPNGRSEAFLDLGCLV